MKTDQDGAQLKLDVGRYSRDGTGHVNDGHLDKAIECFYTAYQKSRQLENDQTERICAFNLGAAYIAIGKYSEGIQYLQKATPPDNAKDGRSNGDLHYNRGYAYDGMSDVKNAMKYYKLAYDEFRTERDNFQMEIECLSKILQIYQKRSEYTDAADIYSLMSDIHGTTNDGLMQVSCLCEMASNLRLAGKQEEAKTTADAAMKQMGTSESGSSGLAVGKLYNDLGIIYTQLQNYDNAAICFERALPLVRNASENSQLEAVITQNLGAAYNFQGDYQRSVQFHKDASEKYAKLKNRNGQGQCFTNLAFAYSQLGDTETAEVTFYHALQAAKDTGDTHSRWQVLEGLGAVKFNKGQYKQAADFLFEAHQCVGEDNKIAAQRIQTKLWSMMHVLGRGRPQYFQGQPGMERTQPLQAVHEEPVLHTSQPGYQSAVGAMQTGQQPMMSQVQPSEVVEQNQREQLQQQQQEQQRQPRMIPMRKKDSFAPHLPKMARGFSGSFMETSTSSSPRYKYLQSGPLVEESSSGSTATDSESSDSDDSDEDDDSSSEEETAKTEEYKSPVVEEIFRSSAKMASSPRPGSRMVSLKRDDIKHDHKRYEQMLLEQEENEEADKDGKKSSSDSDDSSDSSDSSDDSDEESESADELKDKQPEKKAPPLPTQSPPSTYDPSMATYLDPVQGHTIHGSHGGQGDSSHRHAAGDDTVPYATIDFTRKTSSLNASQGMSEENPYYSLQFERNNTGESAQGIDAMPRATRDTVLYNEHQRHLEKEPPPLPDRIDHTDHTDKSSKTCVIM